MLAETSRNEIIKYILKGNEMMKRHAEQRQDLLKQIISIIENSDIKSSTLVNQAIDEVNTLKNHVNKLELQLTDLNSEDAFEYQRLKNLNNIFKELDNREFKRDALVEKVFQLDVNLDSRHELIDILQEYVDMESAQNHGLVAEISETSDLIEDYQSKLFTYDKLARHDPRFKALEILGKHPQGMSFTQLNFMLETSRFESTKIIKELLTMQLVERVNDGELLRVTDVFDSSSMIHQQVTSSLPTEPLISLPQPTV